MYRWRQMSDEERARVLAERQQRGVPWHGPPHPEAPGEFRIVTAACFEHRPILSTPERITWFESELRQALQELDVECTAWCVLPNHYHVLVKIVDMKAFSAGLGRLHGRTSYQMNGEDGTRKRQVWHRCQDRVMRSDRHYAVSVNYIHNNPVKHGYVEKLLDWPWSSFADWLETHGREAMVQMWQDYPLLDYGASWDVFSSCS